MWEWIFLLDYVVVFAVSKIVDWVLIDNIVSTILYFICKCIYPEAHPARPASGRGGGVVMTPPQQTMPTQYTGGQQPYSPPPQSWPQQGYAPPASGQPPQMVYYQPQAMHPLFSRLTLLHPRVTPLHLKVTSCRSNRVTSPSGLRTGLRTPAYHSEPPPPAYAPQQPGPVIFCWRGGCPLLSSCSFR